MKIRITQTKKFCAFIENLSKESPRNEMIDQISERCGVSRITVWRWVNGIAKPLPIYHKTIAEITGIDEKELFQ